MNKKDEKIGMYVHLQNVVLPNVSWDWKSIIFNLIAKNSTINCYVTTKFYGHFNVYGRNKLDWKVVWWL